MVFARSYRPKLDEAGKVLRPWAVAARPRPFQLNRKSLAWILFSASIVFAVPAVGQPPIDPNGFLPREQPDTAEAAISRLDKQPDTPGLARIFATLRKDTGASQQDKAQADALGENSVTLRRAGEGGEARRKLFHAIALLRGQQWTPRAELGAALAVRLNLKAADSSRPVLGVLTFDFPATYRPVGGLKLRLSVRSEATDKLVADLASYNVPARDLIDDPFHFEADMKGVGEGSIWLVADVFDGEGPVARLAAPIQLVRDFEKRRLEVEQKLSRIQGHQSAKASVRYPFDLAEVINGRRRDLPFVFPPAVDGSEKLTDDLASGKDPVFRAKGDQRRHYWFPEAGEIMPYKLYVPSNWDGKKSLPLVVALHAGGGAEDRADLNGILSHEAEKRGWILVTPLGYRPSGDSGNIYPFPPPQAPPPDAKDPDRNHIHELSEIDTMNVIEIVAKEYGVDRSRMYLMGNSGGAQGTYYIASKYPRMWAAIAPSDGPVDARVYPFDNLTGLGSAMIIHGELDNFAPLEASRAMYEGMKSHGVDASFVVVKGAGHPDAWQKIVPQIFDFFAAHSRSDGRDK